MHIFIFIIATFFTHDKFMIDIDCLTYCIFYMVELSYVVKVFVFISTVSTHIRFIRYLYTSILHGTVGL